MFVLFVLFFVFENAVSRSSAVKRKEAVPLE